MQLSNFKNIADEMDTSSPTRHQSAAAAMSSNVLTPKNKMALLLDLPSEATSNDRASTACYSASAVSRHSYNSAQPLSGRDIQLKAFFGSNNEDTIEEIIDYSNDPQGRFINVKHFLKGQRIENEQRAEEDKEHANHRDTSMVYDREVTLDGRVANTKARKSIAQM
jgi:hypothetical protein